MFKFDFNFTSEPQMQEVGCVTSPGDLLLRPTGLRPGIHVWRSRAEGADGGVVLKALPGGGAGGGPAW